MIPASEQDGLLPPGVHDASGEEVVRRFCDGEYRSNLRKAVTDLLDFAFGKGANFVVFGGSFVSAATQPGDIDCMIVFDDEDQIPDFVDRGRLEATSLDIFYASLDQPALVAALVKLFSRNRRGREVGIVAVPLHDAAGRPAWREVQPIDDFTYEVIKRAYINRQFVDLVPDKAIITVHGIKTHAEWNGEVTHLASSRGWIVAPFVYGNIGASVFSRRAKRQEIVDRFRDHVQDISSRYSADTSVIAHSFGTYVVARYLLGFDSPPVTFDTWIMTGAVLNPELDIDQFDGKAAKIVNEVAPNDHAVDWARRGSLWRDDLLGNAGRVGFRRDTPRLQQQRSTIFNHTNVIKRDVVAQRWLPWLEANVGLSRQEAFRRSMRRYGLPEDAMESD